MAAEPVHPFLRQVVRTGDEAADVERRIAEVREDRTLTPDRRDGRIGELLRPLGRLEESERYLRRAVAASSDPGRRAVQHIRLATTLQYCERHVEAAELFEQALVDAPSTHVDFAHQHYAKCLVGMGQLDRARELFDKALELRVARGDASLVSSTERALDQLRALTNATSG